MSSSSRRTFAFSALISASSSAGLAPGAPGVDLGLQHPAAHGLLADPEPFLATTPPPRPSATSTPTVVIDQPHRTLTHLGSIFFGMVRILPTQKDAASNLGRFKGPRAVFEPTGSRRDAASVIFNLPGYRVIDAVDLPLGGRRVKVQPVDRGRRLPRVWGGVVAGARLGGAAGPRRAARRPGGGGGAQAPAGVRRAGLWPADVHSGDRPAAGPGPVHHPAADGGAGGGDRLGPGGRGGRRRLSAWRGGRCRPR